MLDMSVCCGGNSAAIASESNNGLTECDAAKALALAEYPLLNPIIAFQLPLLQRNIHSNGHLLLCNCISKAMGRSPQRLPWKSLLLLPSEKASFENGS